ncbi:MAG TPA: hypothetical protein VFD11_06315 [Thiopseudomonas sp.]|nr:hypothetical protein [Thiopseudomonas sp.]
MVFFLFGFLSLVACYWCLQHISQLDMDQAAMLPFADDRPAAQRVERETGLPCLPEHLAQQCVLIA